MISVNFRMGKIAAAPVNLEKQSSQLTVRRMEGIGVT